MAENMSLADQAVQALAMVKAMDEGLDMEHPERHAIRSMQRVARQVIEAGLRSAIDLAWRPSLYLRIDAMRNPARKFCVMARNCCMFGGVCHFTRSRKTLDLQRLTL